VRRVAKQDLVGSHADPFLSEATRQIAAESR
jgi:hypothetical protein